MVQEPRTVRLHGPTGGASGCVNFSAPQVSIAVDRDWGNLAPDALAQAGVSLRVLGEATWYQVRDDCTSQESPMDFTWRLTYQPLNGLPRDATGDLAPAGSLTPTFTPLPGTYTLRLTATRLPQRITEVRELVIAAARENDWVSLGPDGRVPVLAGQVNGFARDPSRPEMAYVATARGGVWRSENDTASWYPITDHRGLPPGMATADVVVLPSGRILVGTGDAEDKNDFASDGVYWSDDSGATWRTGPGRCRSVSRPEGSVPRMLRDPTDASVVFAASRRNGVFRSSDGGSCWAQLFDGSTDDIALVTSPDGRRELWRASRSGAASIDQALAMTTDLDNGTGWIPAPPPGLALPVPAPSSPVPALVFTCVRLAASGSRLYAALAHAAANSDDDGLLEVWRHDASGAWTRVNRPKDDKGTNHCGGQCDHNLAIAAHPARPDELVLGTVTTFRSTDGGSTWAEMNPGSVGVYADQHVLAFDGENGGAVFAGNDGGIQRLALPESPSAPPTTWSFRNAGLATGLFYDIAVAPWSGTVTSGALQDAGIQERRDGRTWVGIDGGDGVRSGYDAVNPEVNYYTIFTKFANINDRGLRLKHGGTKTVVTPLENLQIVPDPFRPSTIFRWLGAGLEQSNSVGLPETTQWGCAAVPPFLDFMTAFAVPAPGRLLVGYQNREVNVFDLPADIGTSPDCATPSPVVSNRAVWSGAPEVLGLGTEQPKPNAGPITGFAFPQPLHGAPSGDPDPLYVAAGRRDEWAIVKLHRERVDLQGRPRYKLGAVPIAGQAGDADSLWAVANCHGCLEEASILPTSIALDPADPKRLYVGTMAGLAVGMEDAQGHWAWSAEPSVPEAQITVLRVRQGLGGSEGIIRLSTYGRSVYERVRFSPPRALTSDEVKLRITSTVANSAVRSYLVDLPRKATSRAGELTITPMRAGRALPGIWTSPVKVARGQRQARVTVMACGGRSLRIASSDAVELRVSDSTGRAAWRRTVRQKATWHRAGLELATFSASAVDTQNLPRPVAITLTVRAGGRTESLSSSAEYTYGEVDRVTVTAPLRVRTRDGIAEVAGWVDGADHFVAGATVKLTPEGRGRWQVRYKIEAERSKPGRPRRRA